MILSTIGFIVATYVIVTEFNKLGTRKSQTISLEQKDVYTYGYTDSLALHGGNWFYINEIFKHIQDHQKRNRIQTNKALKFKEYPNIGLTWDKLSWHDKRFVEEYLCNRTSLYYKQARYYESIGTDAYTEQYLFNFKCELLPIANDKIRIHYWIPLHDSDYKASYLNDRTDKYDPPTDKQRRTAFYRRQSDFYA